jgi:hypothetical protein
MAMVLAFSMREVDLRVVVPNKFAMGLLHLIQRGSFVEVVIRETPHYIRYLEYPLVVE